MLPNVKIKFANGALNQVVPSPDGALGLLLTGAAVVDKFALATAYILRSYDDLTALGITSTNNPHIEKTVREFYAEAGAGTEVWLMAFADTVKLSDMVDVNANYGKLLINAANGKLRGLVISRKPAEGYTPTITAGLDADVAAAMLKAQALGEWATVTKYAPIFTIIEGYAYSGNPIDLTDLKTLAYDRAYVMIGDSASGSKGVAVGTLAGRVASIPVQRSVARVADGPVKLLNAYIGTKTIEQADVEGLHDKGYITFRTFVTKSGYFFTDDCSASNPATNDYCHLTHRRIIDKAYRIAYATLLEELNNELPITEDGTIPIAIVKALQSEVEGAIVRQMTAFGELSSDVANPDDKGVVCYIDSNQNVASTSQFDVKMRVRPFGYPRYINVDLGFEIVSA